MKWEKKLDDPIPALITEMLARGAAHDTSPCSICRTNAQLLKTAKPGMLPVLHFHGSDLGACKRKILYSKRFPLRAKTYTRPEFLLDGHLHESAIFTILELGAEEGKNLDDSIHHVTVAPARNESERIARIPYSTGDNELRELVIVGHVDGMIEFIYDDDRAETYLLECKSVKQAKFKKVKDGEMDKEWFGQIQTYLRMNHLTRCYLLVKNRETSETLLPIRIDLDSNYLKKRRAALVEVHTALLDGGMVNREHKVRKNDECRWCKFADECWSQDEDTEISRKTNQSRNNKGETNGKKKVKVRSNGVPVLRTRKGIQPE